MFQENNPFLSDEFLDEVVREINQQYGDPVKKQNDVPLNNDNESI